MSKKLAKVIETEAEKFIKQSTKRIPQILEGACLSLMGLEKNYQGHFEIDHCNGRNSVLIDAFRRLASNEAEKLARTYKPSNEDLVNFSEAFEREYKSQMSYVIRDIARAKAKSDAEEIVNKVKIDIEKLLEESLKTE